jgi:hypothetical protein
MRLVAFTCAVRNLDIRQHGDLWDAADVPPSYLRSIEGGLTLAAEMARPRTPGISATDG